MSGQPEGESLDNAELERVMAKLYGGGGNEAAGEQQPAPKPAARSRGFSAWGVAVNAGDDNEDDTKKSKTTQEEGKSAGDFSEPNDSSVEDSRNAAMNRPLLSHPSDDNLDSQKGEKDKAEKKRRLTRLRSKSKRLVMDSGSATFDADEAVPDLDEIDPTTLVKSETFELEKKKVDTEFLTSVLGLVLSIATMMSAAQQFADGVSTKLIKEYGEEGFNWLVQVLTFFPMIYSPLLVLMYNSKRSKDVFHEYLQYGYLVDFPDSGSIDYLVSHLTPILFIFATLSYVAFSAIVFVKFLAPSAIWLIFYKQLLFEIILVWMGMQTIEDNVMTISEFVEAFDDRSDDKKVDRYSTQRAAEMVINLRPAKTRPSYKAYTEKYGVNRRPQKIRMLIRVGIIVAIGVLCTATYFWFRYSSFGESQETWDKQLNPCSQVCYDKAGRTQEMCFNCMCDCATALGIKFDIDECLSFYSVPGCTATSACVLSSNKTCAAA